MEAENWPIDFSFTYPVDCTREQLRKILIALSLHWPGWEHYPWRITRNIHRLIDTPPVNFHYLLVQHCVAAHAAHVVLKGKCEDRNEVLDMMIREKFQFVGVFRLMLIDALRYEMRFTKLTHIRDCTGRDDGHTSVTEEELKARRERYRDTIEGAEHDFMRILTIASMTENMDEMVNGRPVRVWARGVDLPAPVMLQVRSERRNGKKVLLPAKQEALAIVRAGKTVPCLEIEGRVLETKTDVRSQKSEGSNLKPVVSDESSVKTVHVPKDRVEHTVEKTAGAAPRVRVNVTVDTDGSVAGAGKDDISNVELKSHLDKRLDSVGREFSDLQNENDGLKHDLAQVMSNMARKVDPLFFQWIVVMLGAGSLNEAARELKVPAATFSERLQKFVARGGEYKKLYSMVGIRKKEIGRRRMVGFNEFLVEHQGDLAAAEPNVLRELLDGLEDLDGANWHKMRAELIEIVRSELPKE